MPRNRVANLVGTITSSSLDVSVGNLTFSSIAQRITGDMSNATVANRLAFQTSTVNGATQINLIPNGTSVDARWFAYANSANAANSQFAAFGVVNDESRITSGITGSASYAPMTFYAGGSERMRLDANGNVGIGTSTPDSKLAIYNATGNTQIRFGASTNYYWDISRDNDTTGNMWISNYNATGSRTTRLTIDTSGNVGIGTSSPNFKQEISQGSGSAAPSLRQTPQLVLKGWGGSGQYHSGIGFSMSEHTAGYWGSGILEIDDSGSYGAALAFYTSTGAASASPSERMRIDSSGTMSMGTAIGQKMNWYLSGNTKFGVSIASGELRHYAAAGNALTFGSMSTTDGTTFTEQMRITGAGNIGIGNTNPTHLLHVNGTTRSKFFYALADATDDSAQFGNSQSNMRIGGDGAFVRMNTAPWGLNVIAGSGNGNSALYVSTGGNVGIANTNPGQKLTVGGTIESTSGGIKFPDGTSQITAAISIPTLNIVTTNAVTAIAGQHYALANSAQTAVTFPASPSSGDIIWVSVENGLSNNTILRNGNKIKSASEDLVLDIANVSVQMRYVNTAIGWTIT